MIAAAVFLFCLLVGLANLRNTAASLRWIEQGNREAAEEVGRSALRFVILLPLLHEQLVVAKLLERMARLDDRAAADVRFVFITTAREGDGAGSTADVLDRALAQRGDGRFLHVHCTTGADTCKADQLNFGLEQIGLAGTRAADVFIGVYDADSSPDPRTLSHIVARVRELPELQAIQQVPLYFQNMRDASGPRELYLMARPVHNLLFALTVEVPRMRRQPAVFSSPPGSIVRNFGGWLSHGLGHGQFFRLDTLTDLGGFRPPSCDTQFGHLLALRGIPIHAHPMLDVGQTPGSIRVLVRQGIVWFNSMNTCWRTMRLAPGVGAGRYSSIAAWVMLLRLMHSNLAWAVYPLLYLAAMGWCLATGHGALAAFGAVAWGVYLAPVAMIVARFDLWSALSARFEPIATPSIATRLGIVAMFGIEKLGSCLSPMLWCVQAAMRPFRRTRWVLHKTERVAN